MIQLTPKPGYPRGRYRVLEIALAPYYQRRGMSIRGIARKIGVTPRAVRKHLKRVMGGDQSAPQRTSVIEDVRENEDQTTQIQLPSLAKRVNLAAETCFELGQAIRELEQARLEILQARGKERRVLEEALSSPMSRVDLARRWITTGLERHGWKPHQASAGAIGSGRPLDGTRRRRDAPEKQRAKKEQSHDR